MTSGGSVKIAVRRCGCGPRRSSVGLRENGISNASTDGSRPDARLEAGTFLESAASDEIAETQLCLGRASQLVDEIASDVLPPQGVAIVLTERSGSRCPFWLARPPSERFCSDRGRTSGHCTSKGELGIEAWLCWRRPPCLRSVTFIPNSAFSVPPHPFVAGYEWRWRVLSSRGSAQL